MTNKLLLTPFLCATADTAIACLSHRISVRPSVHPSVTQVNQSKGASGRLGATCSRYGSWACARLA